jgi:uncharacterized protein (DUF983 family)
MRADMDKPLAIALYILVMASVIVGVDFMFLRQRFWARLLVNAVIVLIFLVCYLRFIKRA